MSSQRIRPLVAVAVVVAGVILAPRAAPPASAGAAGRLVADLGPDVGSAEHAAACRTHPHLNVGCPPVVK